MKPARPSPAVTRGKPPKNSGSGPASGPAADPAPIDLTPLVSEVIGSGPDAHRLVHVAGWTLTARGSEDPAMEIPDAVLAERLGLRLDKLRELSARHEKSGNISPRVFSPAVGENPRGRGRPGVARFYGEADALFLVTRSDAKRAVALTKEMIQVYIAARRGLLRPATGAALEPAVSAALATIPVMARNIEALTKTVEAVVATVAEQGAAIAAHSAELTSGVIGAAKGREIAESLYAASLRAVGGDKARARSFRASRQQLIRNAVQFNGPRSAWRNLPRPRLAQVESMVDAVEREANDLAKTHRAERAAQAERERQPELRFVKN